MDRRNFLTQSALITATTMLGSKEFFSQGAYQAKVKSPFEMIVSAVRVTGADVDYALPLANRLNQLGQPLYRKLEPTGYSNLGSEWVNSSALLARMNFALDLKVKGKAGERTLSVVVYRNLQGGYALTQSAAK